LIKRGRIDETLLAVIQREMHVCVWDRGAVLNAEYISVFDGNADPAIPLVDFTACQPNFRRHGGVVQPFVDKIRREAIDGVPEERCRPLRASQAGPGAVAGAMPLEGSLPRKFHDTG
jgi:hypothetical protein